MTVSGLTMTSAVRQAVHERDSHAQSHRSAVTSRNRRDRDRFSTCSWCRKASTSSCSAARDRRPLRTVRSSETRTQSSARSVSRQDPNINGGNTYEVFSSHSHEFATRADIQGCYHLEFLFSPPDSRAYFLELNVRLGGTTDKVVRT